MVACTVHTCGNTVMAAVVSPEMVQIMTLFYSIILVCLSHNIHSLNKLQPWALGGHDTILPAEQT